MEKFSFAQADAYTTDLDHQFRDRLYYDVLRFMEQPNAEEAKDIVQATFVNLCTSIRSRRLPPDHPYAYLRRIAWNLYLKSTRERKSVYVSLDQEGITDGQKVLTEIPDDYNRPDVVYELKESVENVTEQIKAIPQALPIDGPSTSEGEKL
jgi:DNA-directed RNA polymerase specialized sigma24 family protein